MRVSIGRPALILAVVLVASRGGSGCASEPAADQALSDAGADDAERSTRDAGGDVVTNYIPESLDGWDAYGDYEPEKCRLYTAKPATLAALAPKWEPCAPLTASSSSGCRQLTLDWERPFSREWISGGAVGLRRAPTSLALMLTRGVDGDVVRMVTDPDGTVLTALRQHSRKCGLGEVASSGDFFAYQVYEAEASGSLSSEGGGAIGGRLGEKPRRLFRFEDKLAHSYIAGPAGIVQTQPTFALNSWTNGSLIAAIPLPPLDASLYLRNPVFVGETLHFGVGSLQYGRLKVWSLADGTRDLLSYGNDALRGYNDLGTDGIHLVWNQGERTDASKVYPRLSVSVSPYAASTASLAPRILRSDITGYGFGTTPFVVGCGYAARSTTFEASPGEFSIGTLIVRLSDGYAWTLPDGDAPTYRWRRPLGVTCDELFSLVEVGEGGNRHWNIARIRIDSLGPPSPIAVSSFLFHPRRLVREDFAWEIHAST